MSETRVIYSVVILFSLVSGLIAWINSDANSDSSIKQTARNECQYVTVGFGENGTVPIHAEKFVSGLEIPWGLAFLPNGDILVTERPGRLRIIKNGSLQPKSVANFQVGNTREGGLLGIALHPNFTSNRYFYVYYTGVKNGEPVNRVQRYILADDHNSAIPDLVVVDNIPAAGVHDAGRIKFGPDNMLYIATGDARVPANSQNATIRSGKILRITPDGGIPNDNPNPSEPWFVRGIRNSQGFDWLNSRTLVITDHGPSGEYLARTGGDEVNIARAGDNLGWPITWRCETQGKMVAPILVWQGAVPAGGAAIYRGNKIPEWTGSLLIGTLGSRHLHRVVFDLNGLPNMQSHEVYLQGEPPQGYGRLRDVENGPDGYLYVTTSNCDGRGVCPSDKDSILKILPGSR